MDVCKYLKLGSELSAINESFCEQVGSRAKPTNLETFPVCFSQWWMTNAIFVIIVKLLQLLLWYIKSALPR